MLFGKRPSDRELLQELMERYGSLALSAARRILGPGPDAEEVAQETFVTVFHNLRKLPGPGSPKTRRYILLIAENKAIDRYRARTRHPELPLLEEILRVPQPEPEAGELGECLMELPQRDRSLLLLKYHFGYTTREAAPMLDMSAEAAYKAEKRAKRRLEELCKERGLLE